jgi:hypothetical protein
MQDSERAEPWKEHSEPEKIPNSGSEQQPILEDTPIQERQETPSGEGGQD